MDKSSRLDIPLDEQVAAWNAWNAQYREQQQGGASELEAQMVEGWLRDTGRTDFDLLEAGCGTGWMCARLEPFGRVTGIDLADEVIERARVRLPNSTFRAGDMLTMPMPERAFDVIVTLETLSHVVDQPALMKRFASWLRPGGYLMIATQNKPMLERCSWVPGPQPGQIRRWVDGKQLRQLLEPDFEVECLTSVWPVGDQGYMRIVNSTLLNRILGRLFGYGRIDALKERRLFGFMLMARARRRGD